MGGYTTDHVRRWQQAIDHVETLERQLIEAKTDLSRVESDFASHLAPSDMLIGEEIGVWANVGFRQEQVITVRKVDPDNYVIQKRGDVKVVKG